MAGMKVRRSILRAALAATAVTLLCAGGAQAATVTIGSPLTAPFAPVAFGNTTQTSFPNPSAANPTSPVAGTVISWRFIGSGLVAPRVLRPGGGTFSGIDRGQVEAGFGFGIISGPFTTRMPIQIGDLFAVNTNTGSDLGVAPTSGATRINWAPPVADGTSRVPDSTFANQEVAIQATVRFCVVPNLLRKKPNAARNALEAANCTVGKARKTKKRRKKKRVIAQGFTPGTSIADTTPVNFKVSKKRKRKR